MAECAGGVFGSSAGCGGCEWGTGCEEGGWCGRSVGCEACEVAVDGREWFEETTRFAGGGAC